MTLNDAIKKIKHLRQWLLFKKVESYTMVGHDRLYELYELVEKIEKQGMSGNFVECGVWKGGAAAVMAEIINKYGERRNLWLFDSFAGLPEPSVADGILAHKQYKRDKGECKIEDVEEVLLKVTGNKKNKVKIVPGWFNETLPAHKQSVGDIGLLRLDCDWYESTKFCLDTLYENVVPGGYVIIDDYRAWPGCQKAVDEFMGINNIDAELVFGSGGAAYFQKPFIVGLDKYWTAESRKYKKPHKRINEIYGEIIKGGSGGSIIDIGCGPASLGEMLKNSNYKYAGVDVFMQKIVFGRYAVFDLEKDNFKNFPFNEIFNVIVISGVIEYLSIDRVRELLRYLNSNLSNKDTKILITYTNFSHYSRKKKTYHPLWVNIRNIDDMKKEFKSAGFSIVKHYPSYYYISRRRLNVPHNAWFSFFSKYFGRQIIFILRQEKK
ncbi:MAG: TylF/MycF/NovP-related O-methyltransferase [Patescibacteria group bacterium]|jgi:SAM-dependent methyltransferase